MATMGGQESPGSVSRTARYRKVTKPLLERRRRARINRCLDELKDLMVGALEVERENISKLEKADILELTVRHLSKLRGPRDQKAEIERFQAGFGHCASEAYHFILSSPGVDSAITQQLVRHLSSQMNDAPIGPLALPALASPVPSDSSLSPSASSRGSPNYYERPAPSSIGSPVSYERPQPRWKDESPRVPVEQSLTCDVATHNIRPIIGRHSEPMTGLLMTVNSDYPPRNPPENYNKQRERQRTPEMKERFDIRGAQTAEAKNLIMQKIREHILERQHREPDPRDTQQRPPRNYGAPHDILPRPGNYPSTNHLPDPNQFSASKDTYPKEIAPRAMKRELSPNIREEAINLSSVSAAKKKVQQKNESPNSADGYYKVKKHQADYKSIHPKKVMIRIPKGDAGHEAGETSRGQVKMREAYQRELNIERNSDDSDVRIAEEYYLRYREQNKDRQQFQDDDDNVAAWRPW